MPDARGEPIWRRAECALTELSVALSYAEKCGRDRWQFAVDVEQLVRLGSSTSDLRLLVEEELVRHAHERTDDKASTRAFENIDSRRIVPASCFVLTDIGADVLRASGLGNGTDSLAGEPNWDPSSRELKLGEVLVKRFRCPAVNQETILSVFQEEGWPSRIDDPLPPVRDREPKRRLHDTTKSLNRNQIRHLLKFHGDGTGQGVCWERAESGD